MSAVDYVRTESKETNSKRFRAFEVVISCKRDLLPSQGPIYIP